MSISLISVVCSLFYCAIAAFACLPGYVDLNHDGHCEICRPGSFDSGHGFCIPCFSETYQPDAGQTECIPCPPNTSSSRGATRCLSCPEGYAVMGTNECGTCPAGMSFDDEGYCVPCSAGFFKAEQGLGSCLPCPKNSYSAFRASECIECPDGQALMRNGSCGKCPPGKFYERYDGECIDCYGGTYTSSPNILPHCYACGGNSFSVRGSTQCVECPAGEVFILSSGSCEKCTPGQFYDMHELSCVDCPYNEFSVYESERYCMSCMPGTFARPGSTTCFECPFGLVYLSEIDACGPCAGEYNDHEARCGWEDTLFVESTDEPGVTTEAIWELPPGFEFEEELEDDLIPSPSPVPDIDVLLSQT